MTRIMTIVCNKLSRLHRSSIISKCFNDKRLYTSLVNNCINHCSKHITSTKSPKYSNILSKGMCEEGNNRNINYDELRKAQKDEKVFIIDVRESSEIEETGKLPGSVHIPMREVTTSFTDLSDEEFEKKFNRKKPDKDAKVIVSCKSGRRASIVQLQMQRLGFQNVYNYNGGWLDWISRQK